MKGLMKLTCLVFLVVLCASIFEPKCEAQNPAPSLLVTFKSCWPESCHDVGPLGTFSSATVGVYAECSNSHTNAVVREFDEIILVTVINCSNPYTPDAEIEVGTTPLFSDDCGSFYDVDFLQFNVLILNTEGIIVWHQNVDQGCDGGDWGPTTLGTKPC